MAARVGHDEVSARLVCNRVLKVLTTVSSHDARHGWLVEGQNEICAYALRYRNAAGWLRGR
jgi:hypothetical protein